MQDRTKGDASDNVVQTQSLASIDGSREAELHGAGGAGAPLTERLGSSYAKLKEHVLKVDLAMLSWTGDDWLPFTSVTRPLTAHLHVPLLPT